MRWLVYFLIGFIVAFALVVYFDNDVEEEVVLGGAGFRDVTLEKGINYDQSDLEYDIDDRSYLRGELQTLFSGGAVAADFDKDGWNDLYVTRLNGSDILYRNIDGKFVDVSSEFRLDLKINSNKVVAMDANNDGWIDLVVSAIRENRSYLFINKKNSFSEEGIARGIIDENNLNGFGIVVGDYNGDGWIDFMTSNWDRTTVRGRDNDAYGKLYRNDDGQFDDVTSRENVRMMTDEGYGDVSFDSAFADIDNDGDLDLLVAADFGNSRLYVNEGDNFVDKTEEWNFGLDEFGMGITTGDYDGDGLVDVFVTSIYCMGDDCGFSMNGNKLYHNMGSRFEEVAGDLGVVDGGWGWETEFFDYDLDGDLDLIMVLGIGEKIMGDHDFSGDAVRLWRNDGGKFADVTSELGLSVIGEGRDVVIFDYDNDGDEDIFIVRNGENGVLFENLIISTPSS